MKTKILVLLSVLFISIKTSSAQSCIVWSDDFGAKQEHHIRTLKAQARMYEVQRQAMTKPKVEYRDMLLMRNAARSAEFHSMREYGIIKNSCLTRDIKSPSFYTK